MVMEKHEFYLRYYVGHKGKFGHEFLEFDLRPDGKLRYANNSHYRKELYISPAVMHEFIRIIDESELLKEDDDSWPTPNRNGRQELEIVLGDNHISFNTKKLGSLLEIDHTQDPEGLRIFYYLVQDIKCLILSLIGLHFRIKP